MADVSNHWNDAATTAALTEAIHEALDVVSGRILAEAAPLVPVFTNGVPPGEPGRSLGGWPPGTLRASIYRESGVDSQGSFAIVATRGPVGRFLGAVNAERRAPQIRRARRYLGDAVDAQIGRPVP